MTAIADTAAYKTTETEKTNGIQTETTGLRYKPNGFQRRNQNNMPKM